MMKTYKRIVSMILALMLTCNLMPLSVLAADNILSYDLDISSQKVTNDSDKLIAIGINFAEALDVDTIGYEVTWSDGLEFVSLEPGAGSNCSFTEDDLYWDETMCLMGWSVNKAVSVQNIGVLTMRVPADTRVGTYSVNIDYIEVFGVDAGISVPSDSITVTITVEEPSAPPETDPPVETDEFELYYTLNSDANATDGYADYDMDAENGNIVVATVYLKNNPAGAAYLQAFDLYLSHHGDLIYKSTDIPGTVTAANGKLTHIQFVASKDIEKAFKAGEDLELGSITFEIDSTGAQFDEDLNITLSADTNISVGNNRVAGEEKTGAQTGDTTSYQPTINNTLKGAEVKNTYEVTYNLDGGTGDDTAQTKQYNVSLTLHSAPTKEGYTFAGWKDANGTIYQAGDPYTGNADLALTAQWEATKHIVKIVNGNGTTENEIAHNETITVPAADTKVGHTFDKWVDADGNTYTVGQQITVTKDLTLTAEYTVNKYEIKFVDYDGTELKTEELAYGATPTAPADPSREADAQYTYTFSGWDPAIVEVTEAKTYKATYSTTVNKYLIKFVNEDGTELQSSEWDYGSTPSYTGETPTKAADAEFTYTFDKWSPAIAAVTGEATYTATYTATKNQYTVTLNDENGESTEQVEYGGEFTVPAAAAKEGYEFTGWLGSDGETYQAGDKITITGDFTLTAQYEIKSYTVTWIVDGKETVETYQFGADVTAKADPSKDGFTFLYWSDENGEATIATKMPAENLTYTATWKVHTYTVKFDANGGTIAEGKDIADMEAVAFNADIAMPTADGWTKEGWVFVGWSKSNTATEAEYAAGTSYSGLTAEDSGTVILYAVWKQNVYPITYNHKDANGVAISPVITSTLQPSYSSADGLTLDAPVATGYTFLGWTSEKLGIDVVTENLSIPKNTIDTVDLTAHWKINKYTITFDTDGGSSVGPITQDYNTEVAEPEEPTKEGYTFGKWVDDRGQEVTFPMDMPAKDVTIKATWTINQYTITFDTVGGTAIAPIKQDYNTTVTAPADPTKTGYTFDGWDKEIPATMPAENVTIKAQWTINQYTITFDTDGGSAVAAITQDYNTAVTAPTAPTKTGYTFAGWDAEIPANMPAENVTITAKWNINQYTITFDTAGGSDVAPITQDYATAVTAPANPTKTGYTFAGWDKAIPATIPAENVTITAQWTINQYTIIFDTDGGTAIEAITQDYNTAVTAPTAPTKTGYTFAGWDTEIPANMPAEDLTIKATWNINQYTITFYDEDGSTELSKITKDYDDDIGTVVMPTKTGYSFSKWVNLDGTDVTIPTKMPATNMTVKAVYSINTYTITFDLTEFGAWAEDGTQNTMEYNINGIETLPIAKNNDPMYSFDKWVVSYAADATEKGWGAAGAKVDAGSVVTTHFGDVTLTATWKQAADLFIEEYKYAGDDQFLLRVKDTLGTGSVYQFNSTAMYYTIDAYYLINSGDSGVFYILISGENLKKTDGGEYERAANGSLVLTEDAYKLLKSVPGTRVELPVSYDINGDGAVNIADANIVYQMTQYTGNYYPDLSEEQRLLADQETSTTVNHEFRASIEDVHAIVEHINTNP